MEIDMIVYMARRMTVDVNEGMSDDDVREAIMEKLRFELGLTEEDVTIDGIGVAEDE